MSTESHNLYILLQLNSLLPLLPPQVSSRKQDPFFDCCLVKYQMAMHNWLFVTLSVKHSGGAAQILCETDLTCDTIPSPLPSPPLTNILFQLTTVHYFHFLCSPASSVKIERVELQKQWQRQTSLLLGLNPSIILLIWRKYNNPYLFILLYIYKAVLLFFFNKQIPLQFIYREVPKLSLHLISLCAFVSPQILIESNGSLAIVVFLTRDHI